MTQTTHVSSLDETVQTTNEWLNALGESLDVDHETAYGALRGSLWTLRDSMPADEAAHLAAELPMLIRGAYFSGWKPSSAPKRMDSAEFFESVRDAGGLGDAGPHPQAAARAVVQLLREHISDGEVDDVLEHLDDEIQSLIRIESA